MEKAQSLLNTLCAIAIPIVIAFYIPKVLLDLLSAKSKALGALRNGAQGLAGKVRERAEGSAFYQKRAMARNQRKAERQRSATESYANAITDSGWRGKRLRQRAGGIGNAAAQNRAYVSGLGAKEKLESQETKDAEFTLKHNGIQRPDQLAAIAAGGTVNGLDGSQNEALRRAAMLKVINAQDAAALTMLFKGERATFDPTTGKTVAGVTEAGNVDFNMLTKEIADNYTTAKGAGAHFVKLPAEVQTDAKLQKAAVENLSTLSAENMAKQDGPSVKAAMLGFTAGAGSTAERQKLWDRANAILNDEKTFNSLKGESVAALEAAGFVRDITSGIPGAPPVIGTPPRP